MERFAPEAIYDYSFLSNPQLTGRGLPVIMVQRAKPDGTGYTADLFAQQHGEMQRLTNRGDALGFVPLGEDVLCFFPRQDGKSGRLFCRIAPEDGTIRTTLETEEEFTPVYAQEDFWIVLKPFNVKPRDQAEAERYEILDEVPFWYNGKGFINGIRNRLYYYSTINGQMYPISPAAFQVKGYAVSPCGKKLAYFGAEYEDVIPATSELRIYSLDERETQTLVPQGELNISFASFGKNGLFFAASDMKSYGVHENHAVYYTPTGARPKCIAKPDLSIGNTVVSDCRLGGGTLFQAAGDQLCFVATGRRGSDLYRMDCAGNYVRITDFIGSLDCFCWDGTLAYAVCMKDYRLQELYEIRQDGLRQCTGFNVGLADASIPIGFTATRGDTQIDGYYIRPQGLEPGRKYPAILDIHGGPKAIYGEVFCHEMQMWAEQGYFVLFCNPTGSDGRGDAFADLRGKYGTVDYEDLMACLDALLEELPAIDSERLFITGGSYGGFMTNWAIGHTQRFRAAAAQRSISNWLSDFCLSDISFQEAEHDHLCTPWSDPEKLWFHSPLKYADRVKTPLLLLHSDLDMHCCMVDALQMLTALKYHGTECRLCLFHGENHDLSRSGTPNNRITRLKELSAWFRRWDVSERPKKG